MSFSLSRPCFFLILCALVSSSCAAPGLVRTSSPEVPPSKTPPTDEEYLVQIGYFDSIFLRYDTRVWEVFSQFPDEPLNDAGESVQALRHRTLPGCVLRENLGRGVPATWKLQITEQKIGALEYSVETWTETEPQEQVGIVYQYPVGERGVGKRIELLLDKEPEKCRRSAEEVLGLSADLIAK